MATWLMTGASAGIGREVLTQLLQAGHRVAAPVRTPAKLADLAAAHPCHLWTTELDLLDTAQIRKVVDEVFGEFGKIDVVFSNAGRGAFGAAEEMTEAQIDEQFALNTIAPIHLLRATLPHLRTQGGGRFIQTSSMGAQITSPGGSIYHASKWALEGFLESAAPEIEPFGVGITMIEPGIIRTGFGAALDVAKGMDVYRNTTVGQIRAAIEANNVTAQAPGDPAKVAAAIVASASQHPAPRRVALGSDAYKSIHAALHERLAELEAGWKVAVSTDYAA
ncbi:SDR family oxidoreductase [Lentzea sp. NPDC054927]